MKNLEPYSAEVRNAVGAGWAFLVLITLFLTFGFFLYCLFNWTFTWMVVAFFILTCVIAHRYGTLLKREEERVKAKAKDWETV